MERRDASWSFTDLEVVRGGGGAGEEARQHHVQGHVARAQLLAVAHLDVLDLRRCARGQTRNSVLFTRERATGGEGASLTVSGVGVGAAAGLDAHQLQLQRLDRHRALVHADLHPP